MVLTAARRFTKVCLATKTSSGAGGRRVGRRETPHQKSGVEGGGGGKEGVRKRRRGRLSGADGGSGGGRGEEEEEKEEGGEVSEVDGDRVSFVKSLTETFSLLSRDPQLFSTKCLSGRETGAQELNQRQSYYTVPYKSAYNVTRVLLLPDGPLDIPSASEVVSHLQEEESPFSPSPCAISPSLHH